MAQKHLDVHEFLSDFIASFLPTVIDQIKTVIDVTVSASVLKVCEEIAMRNADLTTLAATVEVGIQQLIRNSELNQYRQVDLEDLKHKLHLDNSVLLSNGLQSGYLADSENDDLYNRNKEQFNEYIPLSKPAEQYMGVNQRKISEKQGLDKEFRGVETRSLGAWFHEDSRINENEAPPERPSSGPAARVEIPDPDQIPLVTVPGRQPTPAKPNPVPNNSTPVASNQPTESLNRNTGVSNQNTGLSNHSTGASNQCRGASNQCTGTLNQHSATDETISEPARNIDVCLELRLNYSDLCAATNDFDEQFIIGKGAWGSVYRGLLQSDQQRDVAIKRLHLEGCPGDPVSQFRTEIEKLSELSHPNLLPLVGYSVDGPAPCLVYTFMENGSLMDQLVNQERILHWKSRVNIAMESAEGILYLHTVLPKPLVHRDVKSANILLDGEMRPKLGDFGLVRLGASGETKNSIVNTSTAVGTSAYMAPEAFKGDISVKLDVWSFGVVLLELLTGLPPFDEDREDRDIVSYLLDEERSIADHLDQRAGDWEPEILNRLSELALNCLEYKKNNRPNMTFVLKKLREVSTRIPL